MAPRPLGQVGPVQVGQAGGGKFLDFLKKANTFFRDKKLISTVANALGTVGIPYASTVGSVASKLGYGRKRRYKKKKPAIRVVVSGGALSLPGGKIRRTRRKTY